MRAQALMYMMCALWEQAIHVHMYMRLIYASCSRFTTRFGNGFSAAAKRTMAQAENDDDDSDLCKICFDAPINCVFLECGHLVTCIGCGGIMKYEVVHVNENEIDSDAWFYIHIWVHVYRFMCCC